MKIILPFLFLLFFIPTISAQAQQCPDDDWHKDNSSYEFNNTPDEDWTFIDCVHDPIDCELLAFRCGYEEYNYEYRGASCGNRVYMRFACYGRNFR